MDKPTTRAVELLVTAKTTGEEKPALSAYAWSPGGRLLASQPLDAKGGAALRIAVGPEAAAVRVMVGPTAEKGGDLAELVRRGAVEQHVRIEPGDKRVSAAIALDPSVLAPWLRGACTVRGTLTKRIALAGISANHPVCHARVEIFEVDPLYVILPRLPDDLLERLRDLVLIPNPPFPWPPGPDPDPRFEAARPSLAKIAEAPRLKIAAASGSSTAFREALLEFPQIVRPLLCWFWPRFVTLQKVGEATTDACGHFRATFFHGFANPDQPDLYFRAFQTLAGLGEVQIYGPTPIGCHTWWDYTCGTEVSLVTSHPLAVTCAPCAPVIAPERWVLFYGIGAHSAGEVFGGGIAGATSANWGLTSDGRPWGGVLRPRLEFDNALRDIGVRYYQIGWRRGTSGPFQPLTAEVGRHYAYFQGTDLVVAPYRLGPNPMTVAGESLQLFEIPPALPPQGQWSIANQVLDTESGELPSRTAAPGLSRDGQGNLTVGTDESGLYQLRVELFDAAGNRVDASALGIRWRVPVGPLVGTIATRDAATVVQPGGGSLVVGDALIFTLHIDNNQCAGSIAPASTPVGAADECCGVVRYLPGQTATLAWTAVHPHGFATHAFSVVRSRTEIRRTTGGTGSFAWAPTVHELATVALPPACAGHPCTTAAFAETLYVDSLATDGWGSELGYDFSAVAAFAIAPQ